MSATPITQPPEPACITPDEAHAIVGTDKISRSSFYNAIKRGDIPSLRLGRKLLLPRKRFFEWLQSAGTRS